MKKQNKEVRNYASEKGVYLWQIAERLGIADGNFSRKLRSELPKDQKAQIIGIIDELAAEEGD